jgi:hypothetical protein
MKKLFLLALVSLSAQFFAQVGVNTTTPTATLDITAKEPTGTANTVDGVLVPRVDRQRAQSMTSVPTSTMIYVNNISTGTATGTTVNVDAVGFYYFNGTAWVKIATGNGVNIYNADGNLAGVRNVNLNGNNLGFTGTGNVGIGIGAPTAKLEVASGTTGTSGLKFSNLNSGTPAFTGTKTALGVDSSGNVISMGTENTYTGLYVVNGINPTTFSYGGEGSTGTVSYTATAGYGGAPAAALTNAGIFTAPTAGVYRFDFSCAMINTNNPGNRMIFSFRKNETTIVQSTAVGIVINGTIGAAFFTIQTMAAGETMSVYYNNTSGTNGYLADSNYIITRIQ